MNDINFQIEKLSSTNYKSWRTNCELLLTTKGLYGYINGTEETPPEDAEPKEKRMYRLRADQAKAVIILSLSDQYKDLVINEKDASAVWEKLRNTFEPETLVRKARLRREFLELKLKPNEEMACFLARVDRAARDLKDVNINVTDQELGFQYLDYLPDEFENVATSIYHWPQTEFQSSKVKEILINEDNRQRAKRDDEPNGAFINSNKFQANQNWQKGKKFQGQRSERKPNQQQDKGKRERYSGHNKDKPDRKGKGNFINQSFYTEMSGETQSTTVDSENIEWFADSATSSHICHERKLFVNMREVRNFKLKMGEGYSQVTGMGEVVLETVVGKRRFNLTLRDVLYAPSFSRNLISVGKIDKADLKIIINRRKLKVYNNKNPFNERCILEADVTDNNLYKVNINQRKPGQTTLQTETHKEEGDKSPNNQVSDINLWHFRFFHQNFRGLERLSRSKNVNGMNVNGESKECDHCRCSKMTRGPFPRSTGIKTSDILDLIHMDLWEPDQEHIIGKSRFQLTPDQGAFALPSFSVLNTVIADTCPRTAACQLAKYRSADGSCNNLHHDRWGKAGTALQRVLPPKYGDGVNSPRSEGLPSARVVSTVFATDADNSYDNYTLLVMQWGQFLDHDLTHTPVSRGQNGAGLTCCVNGDIIEQRNRHPDCFPIELPRDDHIFAQLGERCMEFVRSLPAPRPECNFGPREQMNQITGYLDGSNIYGSNTRAQHALRTGRGGLLRAQNVRGRPMLPENPDECTDETERLACFKAGDSRVNEQVELAVMHTMWMREHNRVATLLARLNPGWNDETLFQEARRIVVAEMQHITYNEFLPLILGRDYMEKFDLLPKEGGHTQLYDQDLNAGITNVFATAAFRFGHTLIQSNMQGFSKFGTLRENLVLHKNQFEPFILYNEGTFDNFLRGLSTQTCQRFDRFFSKELTDRLFKGDLDFGLDLVALNIQRGRDHGIPPYNDWREVCGLPRARSWQDLLDVMDQQSVAILQRLYRSVDDVDLFVAGVAEKPLKGAMLGQTFVCLVGDQFARLRRGDRFFYEEAGQPSSFTEDQLNSIRKASLARIMCDNSDDLAQMQPLAFFQASFANQRVGCDSESMPRVDLRPWQGERV